MPAMTITVAAKSAPAPGKKRWRVKNQEGMVFQVDPNLAPSLDLNKTYDITYKNDSYNNTTFRVLETVKESSAPTAANVSAQASEGRRAGYIEDPKKAEDIAVLAIVKEWVGRIGVGDTAGLEHALRSARTAWRRHQTSKIETGAVDPDLNDELPEF